MKQSSLAERISVFAKEQAAASAEPGFDRSRWQSLAQIGLFECFAHAPYAAAPQGLEELVQGLRALGRSDGLLGMAFSAGAHMFAVMSSIRKFGTDEQRQRWLPGMARGDLIGAIAVAEPQSSSDAFSMHCKAHAVGSGYRLSGVKRYITNATVCDLALVFAHDEAADQVVCAAVERGNEGMHTHGPIATLGLAGSELGEIELRDCFVPAGHVLAVGQRAKLVFMRAMEWERGLILAPVVGLMERQVEECVRHARRPRPGGSPLLALQAVRHRLADMHRRCHVATLAMEDFLLRKVSGRRCFGEASLVKIIVSEAFVENSLDAMKLYGAFGYTLECRAQQDLRDSLAFELASGTTDIQKNIVAEWLALKVA
jgi:alkylation response protein AidB-like acyl-CoA dehydrogenase